MTISLSFIANIFCNIFRSQDKKLDETITDLILPARNDMNKIRCIKYIANRFYCDSWPGI